MATGDPSNNTSGTITITYTIADCPFRNRCSDNGVKCETCANSPKRSYYRPIESPIPYIPYIPYYPYWYVPYWQPTVTLGTTSTTESHYQST